MADNNLNKKSFFEDFLKIRIKGKPSKETSIGVSSEKDSLGNVLETAISNGEIVDLATLNQFRNIGTDRNSQYRMYDEMATDSILSAALEIYADESTQYNTNGDIIWAESENPTIAKFANKIIEDLQLNDHAWSYVYNLVKYGDIFLQLFTDSDILDDPLTKRLNLTDIDVVKDRKGSQLENYVEMVDNPASLFDIQTRGKTVGFVEVELPDNSDQGPKLINYSFNNTDNNLKIHDPKKFVHITLGETSTRFPETLTLTFGTGDEAKTVSYKVKRGKSILHDLYKIYREIQLMEDSLLLNRVTRSSIIRLLQIEVGDMPKAQVDELLRRFKRMIEQKNFMDKGQGTFTSAANPGPIDNVLYIPTREGKGQVSMSNLGGDVDVKAITDVDYFKNQEYGALKIPKMFLGDTDDAAGFSGGTSLTKLDSRFARTIKRVQKSIITGITTLINLFALDRGLTEYINNFTIKMTSPATTEDSERDEMLDTRLNIADRLLSLIPEDMIKAETRKDIIVNLVSEYLGESVIAELIDADTLLDELTEQEEMNLDMSSEMGAGGGMPSRSGGPNIDIDVGGAERSPRGMGEPTEIEPTGGVEEVPELDMTDIEL